MSKQISRPLHHIRRLDHTGIINNIRDVGKVEEFGRSESKSMSRLHEPGMKIFIVLNERYMMHTEGMIIQYRNGKISCSTLIDMSKEKSE